MKRSIILFVLMLAAGGPLNAQTSAPASCPVCHHQSSLTNVGSIFDDVTQPSRNLSVWNRSICANLFYGSDSAICTNCWYAHNVLMNRWELAKETSDGFARPLRKEIADFPLPEKTAITSGLVYSQEISANSVLDQVGFWTKRDPAYEKTVTDYAQANGVTLEMEHNPGIAEMHVCGDIRTRIQTPDQASEAISEPAVDLGIPQH